MPLSNEAMGLASQKAFFFFFLASLWFTSRECLLAVLSIKVIGQDLRLLQQRA